MTSPVPYAAPTQPQPYPKLVRPRNGRIVGGVAAGLALHLGVDVLYVRIAFAVLAIASGVGVLAYAALWIVTSIDDQVAAPVSKIKVPFAAYVALVAVAVLASAGTISFTSGASWGILIPLMIAAGGALIAWQAYDKGINTATGLFSVFAGSALVLAGVIITALNWNSSNSYGSAMLAAFLTFLGMGALVVPLVLKLWRSLTLEQAEKAASDERAQIASRLHDSVLQTLALIQKRAEDPQEVARLARGQERELRAWLFDAEEKQASTAFAALDKAAGEVEDMFGIRIAPVHVGQDVELTEATQMAVMAAREAMVNAAKHADVDTVDVYAEALAGELAIFVRDRGVGFDPDAVADDRHGISESIQSRMKSVGGAARIKSAPGQGTEVQVTVAY